ncbi:hypothetical protein DFH27DRAFT_385424 [Peziza echinospora]|nr:hypothetical protein DFH27DRAFT_385424 [Peziza echinospora]
MPFYPKSNTYTARNDVNSSSRVGRMPGGAPPGSWGGFSNDLPLNEKLLAAWNRDTALERFGKKIKSTLNPRAIPFHPTCFGKTSDENITTSIAEEPIKQLTPIEHKNKDPREVEGEQLAPHNYTIAKEHGVSAWQKFAKLGEKTGFASRFLC